MINNRQNGRRRGRNGERVPNAPNRGPNPNQRPDNRARGNAVQLHEKYKALARDLQMQGDRVTAEYYLQFADHYFRVLNENRARFEEQRPRREWQPNDGYDDGDGEFEGNESEAVPQQQRGSGEPREGSDPRDGRDGQYETRPRSEPRDEDEPRGGERDDDANGQARGYRGRDRDEPAERFEVDRLPPSIPIAAAEPDSGEAAADDERLADAPPRRRGRPRRPRPEEPATAEV